MNKQALKSLEKAEELKELNALIEKTRKRHHDERNELSSIQYNEARELFIKRLELWAALEPSAEEEEKRLLINAILRNPQVAKPGIRRILVMGLEELSLAELSKLSETPPRLETRSEGTLDNT